MRREKKLRRKSKEKKKIKLAAFPREEPRLPRVSRGPRCGAKVAAAGQPLPGPHSLCTCSPSACSPPRGPGTWCRRGALVPAARPGPAQRGGGSLGSPCPSCHKLAEPAGQRRRGGPCAPPLPTRQDWLGGRGGRAGLAAPGTARLGRRARTAPT